MSRERRGGKADGGMVDDDGAQTQWRYVVGREGSGCQLDKMLVPNPADQVGGVVLILCKPKLAFLADDIEDLEHVR